MENTLSINFSSLSEAAISYWIRMEETAPHTETVSFEEIAIVLDEIYNIDSCTGETGTPVEETTVVEVESEAQLHTLLKEAFTKISYDPCLFNTGTFDYDKDIYIYRSHSDEYNLILNNGKVKTTKIVTKEIDTFVEVNGTSITLDYAVYGNVITDAEISSIDGSTIVFTQEHQGYYRFKYSTRYDLITITVKGTTEAAQECKCLSFYHELVADLILQPPTEDTDAVQVVGCAPSRGGTEEEEPEEPEEPETCYKQVIHQNSCRCSKSSISSFSYVRVVDCDVVFTDGSVAEAEASSFPPDFIDQYYPCPEEEGEWEGAKEEFYIDTCCELPPPDISLPICESITETWWGNYDIDGGRAGRESVPTGDTVSFVPVQPRNGICGEIEYVQDVKAADCCDSEFYEDLEYNTEDSVTQLAPESFGWVLWTGGHQDNPTAGQATVTIHGQGFWLNSLFSNKSKVVQGAVKIYTDENACGTCHISIEDGCSTTQGTIIATEGNWVLYSTDLSLCTGSGEWTVVGIREVTRQSDSEKMWMRYGKDGVYSGDCWSEEGRANAIAICAADYADQTVCGYNNLTISCSTLFGGWNCMVATGKAHYRWGC